MEAYNETTIDHIAGDETCGISTGEYSTKLKLSRLAAEYPDKVKCVAMNQDNSVYFKVPWKWIKVKPPRKVTLSDEQKVEIAERLRAARTNNVKSM